MHSNEERKHRIRFLARAIGAGMHLANDGTLILPSGRPFTGGRLHNGYRKVWLRLDGETRVFTHGRLLCWLHHGPPPQLDSMCDHINGNRQDDRRENLRWVSPQENVRNFTAEGASIRRRVGRNLGKRGRGERNTSAKLTAANVREVHRLLGMGLMKTEIAAQFGVSRSAISLIARGKTWKHVRPLRAAHTAWKSRCEGQEMRGEDDGQEG